MYCTFFAKEPEKIKFTLTATLSLSDWLKVKSALTTDAPKALCWPVSELVQNITELTSKAKSDFYENIVE